jgi:hypothetical protein
MSSASCLRRAIKNTLNAKLVEHGILKQGSFGCDLRDNGMPATHAGLVFISIHGTRQRGKPIDNGSAEIHGVTVTISFKTARSTRIEVGERVLDNITDGLDHVANAVKVFVETYDVLNEANLLSEGMGSRNWFQAGIPLRMTNSPDPVERSGDWWGYVNTGKTMGTPPSGFSKDIMFDGAESYRALGEI